jgi:hypothetical protein
MNITAHLMLEEFEDTKGLIIIRKSHDVGVVEQ